MASFTDNPQLLTNFTPYRPENPLDAMLSVGITRQNKFEEGVQKVQGFVDSLNGLDISKKEIKDYVQGRINQLHQSVNNVSGDFSDQRLISQIGGAAGKIAADPIVQNGIVATNAIRKGFTDIETARKAGKSAPQNEWVFQNMVNQWQSDGRADTKFYGGYTPYVDALEEVRKVYKDMTGGQNISQDALRLDENGNIVINKTLMEGISEERLSAAVNLVTNRPDIQNQFSIDGQFKFKDLDGASMYNRIVEGTQGQLEQINDIITKLQSKLSLSTGGNKIALQNQINAYKAQADQKIKNSQAMISGLGTNVNGVKAQLVADEFRSNVINTFAWEKMVENPLWNQELEEKKFKLSTDQFLYTQLKDKADRDVKLLELSAKSEQDKAKKEGTVYVGDLPVSQSIGEKGAATAYQQRDRLLAQFVDTQRRAMVKIAQELKMPAPYVQDLTTGRWMPNVGPNGYKDADAAKRAVDTILLEGKGEYNKNPTPGLVEAIDQMDNAWDEYNLYDQKVKSIEKTLDPSLESIKKVTGENYRPEFISIYTILNRREGWQQANDYMKAQYGENWRQVLDIGTGTPTQRGSKYRKQYQDFAAALEKNPDLAKNLQSSQKAMESANQAFKGIQSGVQDRAVFFDRSTPEFQRHLDSRFTSLLAGASRFPGQQDADDIRDFLKSTDKESANNQYYGYTTYDTNGNKIAKIGIDRAGEDPIEVQVDLADYERTFPQAKMSDEFRQQFGTRLDLNQRKNTFADPGDEFIEGGLPSAFHLKNGTSENYNLRYHIIQNPMRPSDYNLRIWINEKKTGRPLISAQNFAPPGLGESLNPAQIMETLQKLRNGNFLDTYIKTMYLNNQ